MRLIVCFLFVSYICLSHTTSLRRKAYTFPGISPLVSPTPYPTQSPTKFSNKTQVDYVCLHKNSWYMNKNNHQNTYFKVKTDVTVSYYNAREKYWRVSFSGIPSYGRTFTQSDIDYLNSALFPSSYYVNGKTTANVNQFYEFGADLGYNLQGGCDGYWPPAGNNCPKENIFALQYPFVTQPGIDQSVGGCYVPFTAPMGFFVNGVFINGFNDGYTYNHTHIWRNIALHTQSSSLDVCQGRSYPNGGYGHYGYSKCLAEIVNDTGRAHSPIYGWISDNYPIFGPYDDEGTLAVSCWQLRDYSKHSKTGCPDGRRSCVLKDEFNYKKGVEHAAFPGPPFDGNGVGLQKASPLGSFYQDYFFNATCATQGGRHLDQHNGHNHPPYGFHYHLTVNSAMTPTFPYVAGPQFYGCQVFGCCTSQQLAMNPYYACTQKAVCHQSPVTYRDPDTSPCRATNAPTPSPSPAPTVHQTIPTAQPSPVEKSPTQFPSFRATFAPSPYPTTSQAPTPGTSSFTFPLRRIIE